MTISINVNAKNAEQSMQAFEQAFQKSFEKHVVDLVLDLTAEAKKEAPIKKGTLRASILPYREGLYNWAVSANTSYAAFVHDGTRFITPNPYMSRARLTIISRWNGRGFKVQ